MMEYELRRELWRITEWRDGCVYKTESVGVDWFDEKVVRKNKPATTNLIYVAPSSTGPYADTLNIRRKK